MTENEIQSENLVVNQGVHDSSKICGVEIDAHNSKQIKQGEKKLLQVSDDKCSIVITLYELYSREHAIKLPSNITPGLLAKRIILGEISNNEITQYTQLFAQKFKEFKKPDDVSESDYLLKELSTNFYRFHTNPSIWIYKLNTYIDVNESQYVSKKNIKNDVCSIIITRLDNFITKYEILLYLDLNDVRSNYIFEKKTKRSIYQEFKYKIVYNYNLYLIENYTKSLFIVKKKYFYSIKNCYAYFFVQQLTINEEENVHSTIIEKFLETPKNGSLLIEI